MHEQASGDVAGVPDRMHPLAARQRKRFESRHAALHAALLDIDDEQSVEQQHLWIVGKVGQKGRIEWEYTRHGAPSLIDDIVARDVSDRMH
jgi:hypothetical protein